MRFTFSESLRAAVIAVLALVIAAASWFWATSTSGDLPAPRQEDARRLDSAMTSDTGATAETDEVDRRNVEHPRSVDANEQLVVLVTDRDGRPVPGAQVEVEVFRGAAEILPQHRRPLGLVDETGRLNVPLPIDFPALEGAGTSAIYNLYARVLGCLSAPTCVDASELASSTVRIRVDRVTNLIVEFPMELVHEDSHLVVAGSDSDATPRFSLHTTGAERVNGRAVMRGPCVSVSSRVSVSIVGFNNIPMAYETIDVSSNDPEGCRVQLENRACTLIAEAIDDDKRVADVDLDVFASVRTEGSEQHLETRARIDRSGILRVVLPEWCLGGSLSEFLLVDYAGRRSATLVRDIYPTPGVTEIGDFRLRLLDPIVGGVCIDDRGLPLQDFAVDSVGSDPFADSADRSWSLPTSRDGGRFSVFDFGDLDKVWIRLAARRHVPSPWMPVARGVRNLRVVLQRAGVVIAHAQGRVPRGVVATMEGGPGRPDVVIGVDVEGHTRWAWPTVSPGTYNVVWRVLGQNGALAEIRDIDVSPGEICDDARLTSVDLDTRGVRLHVSAVAGGLPAIAEDSWDDMPWVMWRAVDGWEGLRFSFDDPNEVLALPGQDILVIVPGYEPALAIPKEGSLVAVVKRALRLVVDTTNRSDVVRARLLPKDSHPYGSEAMHLLNGPIDERHWDGWPGLSWRAVRNGRCVFDTPSAGRYVLELDLGLSTERNEVAVLPGSDTTSYVVQ